MAAVILEPKQIKSPTFYPSICHEVMGLAFCDLSFLNVEFQTSFFTLLFHSHQKSLLFSLCAIRVVLSAYLRLLIFLPAILFLACDSSSLAFHMMYSASKLNKQDDNIKLCCTPFPNLSQSVFPFLVLTVASSHTYRFLRRQVKWSGTPISLRIFKFVVIT